MGEPVCNGHRPTDPGGLVGSGEMIVRANGVDLCTEAFGDLADTPILLVSGAGAAMDWWDHEFCARLAAGPRFVVRYDHRDTGRSVAYPPGSPSYSHDDLVDDAVALLDTWNLRTAHIVGISMGGEIGQRLAVDHADRVASLTLVATSPGGPSQPDLPPMADHLRDHFATPRTGPDWSDPEAVVEHLVDAERRFAGELPFDEDQTRRTAQRVVGRTVSMASSMTNHRLAGSDHPVRHRLGLIVAPTLVLHGTADPLFPLGHGQALAPRYPARS